MAKGKQGDIVQHCIYEIATGKWPHGSKLPSVREAEKLWGVHRLTVMAAYHELEKIGLIYSKNRSGYYVSESSSDQESDAELTSLYQKLEKLVKEETDYNPVYVFKLFSAMAVSSSKEAPAHAFLECTQHQAQDHANEIFEMFDVHVSAVCLSDSKTQTPEIPQSVKHLLTTGFHIGEVKALGKKLGLPVSNVPIEVDRSVITKAAETVRKAIVRELESNMSGSIAQDIQAIAGELSIDQRLVTCVEEEVSDLLKSSDHELILLSPRVWGRVSANIKKGKRVKLIRFKISDGSWKQLSNALKIPFSVK